MRLARALPPFALLLGLSASCASVETSDPPRDVADGAAPKDSGGARESGADVGTADDAGRDDATTMKDSSVADVVTKDVGASDAPFDGGTDARADANVVDASDAATNDGAPDSGACAGLTVDPNCVPTAGNFARCAVATATSIYAGYPAANTIDGNTGSSWYAATGQCPGSVCPTTVFVAIELNTPRTIKRVKLAGNTDYPTGYDVLTARIELLDGAGAVVYTADVTTTRGAEPNGDVEHLLATEIACVKTVRVIPLTMEIGQTGPGLAEIEAYAN